MPVKIRDVHPPRGISRQGFRLPIALYRLGLGWMLGKRFVCLTHTGRKSGLARQTVLEVVRYDRDSGSCIVAAGFGASSDWVQNVTHTPQIIFTIGRKSQAGIAERLDAQAAGEELAGYARHHPLAWRELLQVMGFRVDGTEEDVRALGQMIPLFRLKALDMPDVKAG